MMVHLSQEEEFSNLLLKMWNGRLREENDYVDIPGNFCQIVRYLKCFADRIYLQLDNLSNKDAS